MKKLPNVESCIVAETKITKYLLNLDSEAGNSKAKFFLARGFKLEEWQVLADTLKNHALNNPVDDILEVSDGVKYVIIGTIMTPDGKNPIILSVWKIDAGTEIPRLITARPT